MLMHLPFQLVAVSVATCLMIASALHSRLLQRSHTETCPSCGRTRVRGVCEVCNRPR
jgi:formate dehydrogenase maturation protein FdhE